MATEAPPVPRLKERYREEREKRLRKEGEAQYLEVEDDLAGLDDADLAVAGGDLHRAGEVDDEPEGDREAPAPAEATPGGRLRPLADPLRSPAGGLPATAQGDVGRRGAFAPIPFAGCRLARPGGGCC